MDTTLSLYPLVYLPVQLPGDGSLPLHRRRRMGLHAAVGADDDGGGLAEARRGGRRKGGREDEGEGREG